MAFADPQSVNVTGSSVSLARTGSGIGTGTFQSNDGTIQLQIQHTAGRRFRRAFSITLKKYAVDPTDSSQNIPVSATVRLVVDQPVQGFSVADLTTMITGLTTSLTASTNANAIKLLGAEI